MRCFHSLRLFYQVHATLQNKRVWITTLFVFKSCAYQPDVRFSSVLIKNIVCVYLKSTTDIVSTLIINHRKEKKRRGFAYINDK